MSKKNNRNTRKKSLPGVPLFLKPPPLSRKSSLTSLKSSSSRNSSSYSPFRTITPNKIEAAQRSDTPLSEIASLLVNRLTPNEEARLRRSHRDSSVGKYNTNSKFDLSLLNKNHYRYLNSCDPNLSGLQKIACNEKRYYTAIYALQKMKDELKLPERLPLEWEEIIKRNLTKYYNSASQLFKLEYIPDFYFKNQKLISTIITIPESVRYIGEGAFDGCGLEEVIFTNKVQLGTDCFRNNNIKNLDLSKIGIVNGWAKSKYKPQDISTNSFRNNCLEKIILPENIDVKIGAYVFQSERNNLKIIYNMRKTMLFDEKGSFSPHGDFSFGVTEDKLKKGYYKENQNGLLTWIKEHQLAVEAEKLSINDEIKMDKLRVEEEILRLEEETKLAIDEFEAEILSLDEEKNALEEKKIRWDEDKSLKKNLLEKQKLELTEAKLDKLRDIENNKYLGKKSNYKPVYT